MKRSPSPASRSSPIRPARSIGRTNSCWSSPTCIWKKARPLPRAACCCRPTTRRRHWRGWRGLRRTLRAAARDRARRQLPRWRRAVAHERRRPRGAHQRCSAAATGSGSPAITIPIRPTASAAALPTTLGVRPADLPSRACRAKPCDGEIAGHLHPVARVAQRGRAVSRRCFAGDGRRLVMPAFGAYAGGLNVRDRAIIGSCSARSPSPPTCSASAASMPSPRRGASD